jgi:hypothetical protein
MPSNRVVAHGYSTAHKKTVKGASMQHSHGNRRRQRLPIPAALGAAWPLLFTVGAAAQPAPPTIECGLTMTRAEAAMAWQLHLAGAYIPPAHPRGVCIVPLTIHIVRSSSGTGGLAQQWANQCIVDANLLFAPAGIQFVQPGPTRFIDSNLFYSGINTLAQINQLRQTDPVPNTINIYFTEHLAYEAGALCGISSFTFSSVQGIAMNNNCTPRSGNHSTFTHELGHYFDLFHTHEPAFGIECTSGANCATAGDLICDTPADPTLSSVVNSLCAYIGAAPPPCPGDPPYNPDTRNVMSYARHTCRNHFSAGQDTRALATLLNLRPELHCEPGTIWVDFSYSGTETGSFLQPYNTLAEGAAAAQTGGRVVIKAGSSPETILINRSMTLDSFGGTARIGE